MPISMTQQRKKHKLFVKERRKVIEEAISLKENGNGIQDRVTLNGIEASRLLQLVHVLSRGTWQK